MFRPQIFISHSAKETIAREVLTALREKLEQAGFDVLLDETRLREGCDWRYEIHRWLSLCNGAVILFSDAALRSAWVLKEATVLTWRRSLDQSFGVLPILLPPVQRKELDRDPFAPLSINAIQAVPYGGVAETVNKVAEWFAPLKSTPDAESPMQKLERVIVPWLRRVDPQVLSDVARDLGSDEEGWGASSDCVKLLARQLLHGDLCSVAKAMRVLAPHLEERAAYNIIDIVTPFWVDPLAVAPIPELVKRPWAQRAVSVNGRFLATGEMYIRRACCRFPSWTVLKVTNTSGEDQVGALVSEIRAALREGLHLPLEDTDEDIEEFVAHLEQDEPLFVVLLGHLDNEVLRELRKRFPSLTFFLLTGDEIPDLEEMKRHGVKFLTPELEPGRERDAYNLYREARSVVARSR